MSHIEYPALALYSAEAEFLSNFTQYLRIKLPFIRIDMEQFYEIIATPIANKVREIDITKNLSDPIFLVREYFGSSRLFSALLNTLLQRLNMISQKFLKLQVPFIVVKFSTDIPKESQNTKAFSQY